MGWARRVGNCGGEVNVLILFLRAHMLWCPHYAHHHRILPSCGKILSQAEVPYLGKSFKPLKAMQNYRRQDIKASIKDFYWTTKPASAPPRGVVWVLLWSSWRGGVRKQYPLRLHNLKKQFFYRLQYGSDLFNFHNKKNDLDKGKGSRSDLVCQKCTARYRPGFIKLWGETRIPH